MMHMKYLAGYTAEIGEIMAEDLGLTHRISHGIFKVNSEHKGARF